MNRYQQTYLAESAEKEPQASIGYIFNPTKGQVKGEKATSRNYSCVPQITETQPVKKASHLTRQASNAVKRKRSTRCPKSKRNDCPVCRLPDCGECQSCK